MSQAVLIRSGTGFRNLIQIKANPLDTVRITDPKGEVTTVTVDSTGSMMYLVRKKGSWTFYGIASTVTATLGITSRREAYIADVTFSPTLKIVGNPGDTVSVSGPGNYASTQTIPSDGSTNLSVNLPGLYSAVGSETAVVASVNATSTNTTYTLNVSFSATVNVTTNPNETITLTNTSGVTKTYSAKASVKGIAKVTVKRKGIYVISSSAPVETTVPSLNSVFSVEASKNAGSYKAIFVKVTACTIAAGQYDTSTAYIYWNLSNTSYYDGMNVRYSSTDYPESISSGAEVGTGKGVARDINISNLNKPSFQTGNLIIGTTYYFAGWAYVTINGTNYYGQPATSSTNLKNISGEYGFLKFTNESSYWIVPDGVRNIEGCCVGGGGAGGVASSQTRSGCGGGGGYVSFFTTTVIPGETLTINVGAGGTSVWSLYNDRAHKNGYPGAKSSIYRGSVLLTEAGGGQGGGYSTTGKGGDGGSGGGAGWFKITSNNDTEAYASPGAGGVNGGNGGNSSTRLEGKDYICYGGIGQVYNGGLNNGNSTSFYGVIYADGGGGGGGGAAGNNGGGAGGTGANSHGGHATNGTGSGGGGADYLHGALDSSFTTQSGAGGSGVCIIKAIAAA